MLSKQAYFMLFLNLILVLNSCKEVGKSQVSEIDYGETTYYRPFLWEKMTSEILEKTLVLEFNNYAIQDPGTYVELDLVTKKDSQSLITHPDVNVYLNDKLIASNPIKLMASDFIDDKEISIGIEFLPRAKQDIYQGYIKIGQTNLDRINDVAVEMGKPNDPIYRWKLTYIKVWNPLFIRLFILLTIIITLLGIWFVLLKKRLYPKFQGGQIAIFKDDSEELISLTNKTACITGNKSIRQNSLGKLFRGQKIHYRTPENIQIVIRPTNFKFHKDKIYRRKLLPAIYLRECKNILLERIEPDRIRIFDKDYLYNNYIYLINDERKIQYLNINHPFINP